LQQQQLWAADSQDMAMQAEHQAALQRPGQPLQQTWAAYFPEAPYDASDRRVLLMQELLQTLASDAGWQLLQFVPYQQGHVVHMDYARLQQVTGSADLAAALEMQPLEGLGCLRAAVHQVGWTNLNPSVPSSMSHVGG
jgi:hypothetical protein